MARENPECPTGDGIVIGRRACRYRSGRDSMALQHSRLRFTVHARPKSLRDRHSWIPASLCAETQDPAVRRYTPENRLLLPRGLRQVSERRR